MLNNVPTAINALTRNVVINHPNTFNCIVIRKKMLRPDPLVSGLPTMGGLGVIGSDDEEQVDYEFIGNGYAMPAEQFSESQMMERRDANNGFANEFKFLIEPEAVGEFELKSRDIFYQIIGDIRLAFEIVGIETTSNIPPYTQRYICNRRDDLHFVDNG